MFKLVYADQKGRVFEDVNFGAVCRSGYDLLEPDEAEMVPMPEGASLVVLPGRRPAAVGRQGRCRPYPVPGAQAVAALLPQGWLRTLLPAYGRQKGQLPLFGYTAVAWRDDRFYVAAIPAAGNEDLRRWDPELFNTGELEELLSSRQAEFPNNRIMRQLVHCSREYGCFTAQNMIYRRFEAGLPLSPTCNANCLGCISLQPAECCPSPQNRIDFIPSQDEAVELAVAHLEGGGDMVSFGQGCEGEPLVQGELAASIIREVRTLTAKGRINANTNAGYFPGVKAVVDAGIDSLRVSLNSPRAESYNPYYRQQLYTVDDVVKSVVYARDREVFVSVNLLVLPGVSDREEEIESLLQFIEKTRINQVQFRNLNIDPDVYLEIMPTAQGEICGMHTLYEAVKETGVMVR